MASGFEKVFNMQGFDKDASPKWQMVPVGGIRYTALRDGAGLTVTSSNAAIVTVTEINRTTLPTAGLEPMPLQATDRIFRLNGVAKGNARVQAKNAAGAIVVELEIDTKNKKTVRATFNFVKDTGGHETARVPAAAAHWIATMRYIYSGQANVEPTLRMTRHVIVGSNLGAVVMWTPGAGNEWGLVTAKGDSGADMNYFLVWEYEQDSTPNHDDTDAGTMGSNCIFEDHAGTAIGVTMAHEMGHYLGLPDRYSAAQKLNLMYGITDARGIHLPKGDVNVINP
jgi:hypothetical protein